VTEVLICAGKIEAFRVKQGNDWHWKLVIVHDGKCPEWCR